MRIYYVPVNKHFNCINPFNSHNNPPTEILLTYHIEKDTETEFAKGHTARKHKS